MITQKQSQAHLSSWQYDLQNCVTDLKELSDILELDLSELTKSYKLNSFKLKVPRAFLSRIDKGKINDPLLIQILPHDIELLETFGYSSDPLLEKQYNPMPGLLHKYFGRILVLFTSHCAIHCRYCFRREFPYQENNAGIKGLDGILDYIEIHKEIYEIILSGGDPLSCKDTYLQNFMSKIEKISHITTVRIHTRFPIVIPARITSDLINIFKQTRLNIVVVLHCNHPREIDFNVERAIHLLHSAGVTLLNQSVLLKGVNDSSETLISLSKKLFKNKVLPYYLHLLDKVTGSAHFDVNQEQAIEIVKKMTHSLSGYLVPKLVQEKSGYLSKQSLPIS